MRTMPAHEYKGYSVVVNALPGPNDKYYSVFSIHRSSPSSPADQVVLVHQEGRRAEVICETAGDAHHHATERAHAWIDARPD
jgi:hypothetical protein